jgi:transposase InsO family protein
LLRRDRPYGLPGLIEINRAPERHPNQTQAAIEEAVLGLRQAHMTWGPRNHPSDEDLSLGRPKLKRILERDQPGRIWPATSTVGEIVWHAVASNRVWCADFKGWFRASDGTRVDPLTITDACSRYLPLQRMANPARPAHS